MNERDFDSTLQIVLIASTTMNEPRNRKCIPKYFRDDLFQAVEKSWHFDVYRTISHAQVLSVNPSPLNIETVRKLP
jgi:hypothetical protein